MGLPQVTMGFIVIRKWSIKNNLDDLGFWLFLEIPNNYLLFCFDHLLYDGVIICIYKSILYI